MYQVIARKYRPQGFAELVSQEHVKTTLENAISQGRIAHGYIFSGQRGTGKTTVARILARCLNCQTGPTSKPCGTCASCTEIAAGSSVDVIEIDAASNRGINEMRELRESVRYRPARDRYKVFIVDEAHQITNEAFNALLKTLEEPPEWVVFILCTTESHKIPSTILSRCQQFSFRSVDFNDLIARMQWIAGEEGITADPEALSVLAQAGEGSVRDSLSAMDQAIACCGTNLTAPEVRGLLGMFSLESLAQVAQALAAGDSQKMLEIVAELDANGRSLQHFSRELARFFRNLLVVKIAGGVTKLVSASEPEQQKLAVTAKGFSEEDLTRYLQISLDLFRDLQSSLQPRLHLEIGLLRLVHAGKLQSIEDALASLGSGPSGSGPIGGGPIGGGGSIGGGSAGGPMRGPQAPPSSQAPRGGSSFRADAPSAASSTLSPSSTPSAGPAISKFAAPQAKSVSAPMAVAASDDSGFDAPPFDHMPVEGSAASSAGNASVVGQVAANKAAPMPEPSPMAGGADFRSRLHAALVEARMMHLADALEQAHVAESAGELVITAPKMYQMFLKQPDFEAAAKKLAGRPIRLTLKVGEASSAAISSSSPNGAAKPAAAAAGSEEATARAMEHPEVKRFQELFPDAQVRAVRDLRT
jgi:DNA polymerase-3 subunit gamma/tau